jgi:hypothetical protein
VSVLGFEPKKLQRNRTANCAAVSCPKQNRNRTERYRHNLPQAPQTYRLAHFNRCASGFAEKMAGVRPALGDSIVCNYTPTSLATIPLTGDILIIHCTRTSQLYKLTFYPTSRKYLYNFGRRHSSRSCKEVFRTLCWW